MRIPPVSTTHNPDSSAKILLTSSRFLRLDKENAVSRPCESAMKRLNPKGCHKFFGLLLLGVALMFLGCRCDEEQVEWADQQNQEQGLSAEPQAENPASEKQEPVTIPVEEPSQKPKKTPKRSK
jgi:hypothetical protein